MCRCTCTKVQVLMPQEVIDPVRGLVGRNGFSQYVTDAVAENLRFDLLADLTAELEAEYGPVPEEVRAQTRREWPGCDPN
jgi:hypothetical protein